jgi:hypothetical protein
MDMYYDDEYWEYHLVAGYWDTWAGCLEMFAGQSYLLGAECLYKSQDCVHWSLSP